MNTQQNNSKLTQLPVVMFLAGICCFLWGSATPAIKTGYQLFQIQSSDAMSIILFAGMRFVLAGFLVILFHSIQERHWIMPEPGYCIPLFKPDSSSVLFLLYRTGSCKWSTRCHYHRRKCFYLYISGKPDLQV